MLDSSQTSLSDIVCKVVMFPSALLASGQVSKRVGLWAGDFETELAFLAILLLLTLASVL